MARRFALTLLKPHKKIHSSVADALEGRLAAGRRSAKMRLIREVKSSKQLETTRKMMGAKVIRSMAEFDGSMAAQQRADRDSHAAMLDNFLKEAQMSSITTLSMMAAGVVSTMVFLSKYDVKLPVVKRKLRAKEM